MAEKKSNKAPGAPRKRRKLAGKSTGLSPAELLATSATSSVSELQKTIEDDGGKVLASYREPYGGQWLILATLPIEQVEPTPYQRNLSDTHVRKLESVIAKLGRFLDPIIVVCGKKNPDGVRYWTPNGNHRLSALRTLRAKCSPPIVGPAASTAYPLPALRTATSDNL